ncbi:PD-(D/E)XK nuclease family protein [Mycobacteroides immunogenum]|uniref:PD-(D/E)XK nuclease family protein n=1 Tax=Mycobacteroides immunogenum TaxID=83262 RepID=UPI0025B73805|nr:PD-(D/E)XK nuclease family protein [Mycobacteroides immunogenum]WJR32507.1 PD-(D/E)XK nuclease family protein [Mycobacteroides immunogenum]
MSEIGSPTGVLVTGIEASDAILPDTPRRWSFSSLKEIEACPMRYMLSRAAYPGLGVENGYPRLPSVPALIGDIVHGALEAIVKALVEAGCHSLEAPAAFDVLKNLGGITTVVDGTIKEKLELLADNPRLNAEQRRRLARDLDDGVAGARVRVQEYLSRAQFGPQLAGVPAPARSSAAQEYRTTGRQRARLGANTETTVVSEDLRLMGAIDLLVVHTDHAAILDYKTGAEDPSHADQLRMYALLWDLDREVNPSGLPATELKAAYANHDVMITAPTSSELREFEKSIRERIAAADALFDTDVPLAKPSIEQCERCQVRQLCSDYWTSPAVMDPADVEVGEWFDYEGLVGPPNGIRSLWMMDDAGRRDLLLRTTPTFESLEQGAMVRILGLRRDEDPEASTPIATMTARSEVFVLADDH